jgi:hypothetical protein
MGSKSSEWDRYSTSTPLVALAARAKHHAASHGYEENTPSCHADTHIYAWSGKWCVTCSHTAHLMITAAPG